MPKLSLQIITFILIFGIFFGFHHIAFAQTSPEPTLPTTPSGTPTATPFPPPSNPINLTLSPITLQLEVNPGETKTGEIKIRNNSTEPEALKVSFTTFSFNEATQQVNLNNQSDETFLQWISVDQPEFVVQPAEWSTIKVTFAPPP